MTKTIKQFTALAVLMAVATSVSGSQLVREFRGSENRTTAAFTVEAPWILDWRLDADYDQLVALQLTLIEAKTGRHVGQVLKTQRRGNGVKLFQQPGTFQIRVSGTLARWTIKIEQLTREEAELYTPKNPDQPPGIGQK